MLDQGVLSKIRQAVNLELGSERAVNPAAEIEAERLMQDAVTYAGKLNIPAAEVWSAKESLIEEIQGHESDAPVYAFG